MTPDFNVAMQSIQQKEVQVRLMQQKHFELACQLYAAGIDLTAPVEHLPILAQNALTAASVMFQVAGLIKGEG